MDVVQVNDIGTYAFHLRNERACGTGRSSAVLVEHSRSDTVACDIQIIPDPDEAGLVGRRTTPVGDVTLMPFGGQRVSDVLHYSTGTAAANNRVDL